MNKNFLLKGKTARKLYSAVKDLPIYDFHCHLSVDDIIADKPFMNLTELWLSGDHYKWRQMRTFGIDERKITGSASPFEKFLSYSKMLGYAAGNPLTHWSQAELQKYFGISEPLNEDSASLIWYKTEKMMADGKFAPSSLINASNVYAVCIIEDAFADVKRYKLLNDSGKIKAKILPAFRGDKAMNVFAKNYNDSICRLESVTGVNADNYEGLKKAVCAQLDNFVAAGATGADFAFEGLRSNELSADELNRVFLAARKGVAPSSEDAAAFVFHTLSFMVEECYKRGLVVQLHAGAMRDNNSTMFDSLGPDTGYDGISSEPYIPALKDLLNNADIKALLGKTLIFNLNPSDTDTLLTLCGCFQGDGVKGRVQLGAAWWFNDTLDGMNNHLRSFSRLSNLDCFVGMLTDSRSFVSYPRHDYFRRILCNYLGNLADNGEYIQPYSYLEKIAKDISFENASEYFKK